MLVDYHVHALGHNDYPHTAETAAAFLEVARGNGISEVGFADHDRYHELFDFAALRSAQERFPDVAIKIGIEINYHSEEDAEVARLAGRYDLDFLIGSVHDIGEWVLDHPRSIPDYDQWDLDELYQAYFRIIDAAVRSRLFSTIGHLDLIKVFGFRSKSPVLGIVEPTLRLLREFDQCVEINTNGWHKPIGEPYPSEEILRRCFELDIPITLSSDAHHPEQAGRDVARAAEIARRVGYRKVCTFRRMRREEVPF